MATVHEINHDSSTTLSAHYDTINDPENVFSVTAAAALNSSTYGLQCDYDAGIGATSNIADNFTALSGNDFRFRIRVNFDNLTISGVNTLLMVVELRNSVGSTLFRYVFDTTTTRVRLFAQYFDDVGNGSTSFFTFPRGEVCCEIRAVQETGASAQDGIMELLIDGDVMQTISTVENFALWSASGGISRIYIATGVADPDTGGIAYLDEILLDDDSTTAICPVFSYNYILSQGGLA